VILTFDKLKSRLLKMENRALGIIATVLTAVTFLNSGFGQDVVDEDASRQISEIERDLMKGELSLASSKARELSRFRLAPGATFQTRFAIAKTVFSVELSGAAALSSGSLTVTLSDLEPLIQAHKNLLEVIDDEVTTPSRPLGELGLLRLQGARQRSHYEMASVFVATRNFNDAFNSLDKVEAIFEETRELHEREHEVSIINNGQTTKRKVTQREMANLLPNTEILERRIDYAQRAQLVDNERYREVLVHALQAYCNEIPKHTFAYDHARQVMELEGTLDLDRLAIYLDQCEDKSSLQYTGSVLSFGNLLRSAGKLEEALKRYEDALARGVRPERMSELYYVLGKTQESLNHPAEAERYYLAADAIRGGRFDAIPDAIRRAKKKQAAALETSESGEVPANSSYTGTLLLGVAVGVLALGVLLWRRRTRRHE
jgi:tetratricopeptide (TPR) repeat protein